MLVLLAKKRIEQKWLRCTLVLWLVYVATLGLGASANANDQDSDLAGTPVAVVEVTVPATETPGEEPVAAAEPVLESFVSPELSPTVIPDAPESGPSESSNVAQSAEESESPTAALSIINEVVVQPESAPECKSNDSVSSQVLRASEYIDYRCRFALQVEGDSGVLSELQASFSVVVKVPSGLSVRFRTSPNITDSWSEAFSEEAELQSERIDPDAIKIVDGGLIVFEFLLRVERDSCTEVSGDLRVETFGNVLAPEGDDIAIVVKNSRTDSEVLNLIYPEVSAQNPVLSVLELTVVPVTFSLGDQATTGQMSIQVDISAPMCNAYNVLVSIRGIDQSGDVRLREVSSTSPSIEALALESAVNSNVATAIGLIPATATPTSGVITVKFSVLVPAGIAAGSLTLTATTSTRPLVD